MASAPRSASSVRYEAACRARPAGRNFSSGAVASKMMHLRIDYGRTGLEFEVPSGVDVQLVESPRITPLGDPLGTVRRALEQPIGTPPLRDLARGKRDAVVVISDKTRPV